MAQSQFKISIDLGRIELPHGSALNAEVFPTLSYTVQRIAEAAQEQWVKYASGQPLPNGQVISNRTGEYARSINIRHTGDFSAEVYSSLPYADAIERGSPARDLKQMLGSSLKVRLSAKGIRYMIIPFRWNRPISVMGQGMPMSVWDWWREAGRKTSSITGTYRRLSGTGAYDIRTRERITVPGRKYAWGDRLTKRALNLLGIEGKQADRLEGMVHFRNPGAKKMGGAGHDQYLTFRVMSENSKGWVVPAQEGKWPARTVAQQLQPVAEAAFKHAVEQDVAALLGAKVE